MRTDEKAQIKKLFENVCLAWNEGDGQRFGACFTDDCDYVTFQGDHLRGRQAVADSHRQLFEGILRGSTLTGEVKSIRLLTPDVAIFHAVGAIQLRWQKKAPESRQSINTNVAINQGGEWKIVAFHNCRIQRPGLLQRLVMRLSQ